MKTILAGLLLATFAVALHAADRAEDRDVPAWVKARVRAAQLTPEESQFDKIGWAKSIAQAEALAHQYNRPVFLFTYNGNIDTGRC